VIARAWVAFSRPDDAGLLRTDWKSSILYCDNSMRRHVFSTDEKNSILFFTDRRIIGVFAIDQMNNAVFLIDVCFDRVLVRDQKISVLPPAE
jgi:hypothetical protein